MIKLNYLQYSKLKNIEISNDFSLSALISNDKFEALNIEYKNLFGFNKLKTIAFSKEGFLGLFLELKGKIAISYGESEAVVEAGLLYETLGFDITWINLNKDGKVNLYELENKNIDFLFLSSYVMDTFVKTSIEDVKNLTNAKIISNASADFNKNSDVIYFDPYKLTGHFFHGLILFNDNFAGKAEAIYLFTGANPQAAFGNSTGDQQMLEYAEANNGAHLLMLIHHDDPMREYSYGVNSKIGTFSDELMAEAKKRGWNVVSMKNDWKKIFTFDR